MSCFYFGYDLEKEKDVSSDVSSREERESNGWITGNEERSWGMGEKESVDSHCAAKGNKLLKGREEGS